jgi:hypothetical protein
VAAQDVQLQAGLALATEAYDQKLLRLNLLRVTGTLRETLLNLPTTRPTTAPTQFGVGRSAFDVRHSS